MKIAVCLPSLNEAKTIGDVTRVVDRGLSEVCVRYSDAKVEIVNFDSGSNDHTSKIFLDIATTAPKKSFTLTDHPGKGRNILEFCRYIEKYNIDYCLTIDSDLTSIEPIWIFSLLEPLLSRSATYVTPLYKRSRFEGSSTNHFAFPLIYAMTGRFVRQPIAGDFAFTRDMARLFLKSEFSSATAIGRYGIDIFMTITAICGGAILAQVPLGRKIHGPSFHKLEDMFPQIAAAALLSMKPKVLAGDKAQGERTDGGMLSDSHFSHKDKVFKMKEAAIATLKNLRATSWCDEQDIIEYVQIAGDEAFSNQEMSHIWIKILGQWIRHYQGSNISIQSAEIAGNELLPFFTLRAVNFWLWAENVDALDADGVVLRQAKLLRSMLAQPR